MKGKDIIENMTKGQVKTKWNNSTHCQVESDSGILICVIDPYKKTGNLQMDFLQYDANSRLICEAFNVANQTGMTPLMLQSELEKAKELLKILYGFGIDDDISNEVYNFLNEGKK